MWMNSSEIDAAVERVHSVAGKSKCLYTGALFLRDFRDLIDRISDGWSHWSYGTKCSDDLQALVGQRGLIVLENTDPKAVRAAMLKVRRFLQRCSQTRGNAEVRAFLAAHPVR